MVEISYLYDCHDFLFAGIFVLVVPFCRTMILQMELFCGLLIRFCLTKRAPVCHLAQGPSKVRSGPACNGGEFIGTTTEVVVVFYFDSVRFG